MSEWLMAGVSRHILRLPPAIGKMRVSQLADRARAEVDVVSTQHRAVHHFVVREVPRFGRPMPPQTIAEGLDLPLPTVIQILTDLEARKIFLFRASRSVKISVTVGSGRWRPSAMVCGGIGLPNRGSSLTTKW